MRASLKTDVCELANELCDEMRLFLDVRKIDLVEEMAPEGLCLVVAVKEQDGFYAKAVLFLDGQRQCERDFHTRTRTDEALERKKQRKRAAKQAVYDCLCAHFKRQMPWGSLTGIRPTKLVRMLSRVEGKERAEEILQEQYGVSREKLALAQAICAQQAPILASVNEGSIDVYIGIPFCTTRCAYCSFASGLVSKDGEQERAYVAALLEEMDLCAPIFAQYAVRSVYIGGGTPTALAPDLLEQVLKAAGRIATGAAEFTVEAGRPDTITEQKLALIKQAGADRISVNAQTTCESTLARIGRAHGVQAFYEAFALAKTFQFSAINTDMIVGLPGEDLATVERTARDLIALLAENITIHTLAIKHGSQFAKENVRAFASNEEAQAMLSSLQGMLGEAGYLPYYLYRQKYMAGNLENVGYAKPGTACIYNIDIMEETMSILALGAGGISKRLFAERDRIERAPNVKDIAHYIGRVQEMATRKRALFAPKN